MRYGTGGGFSYGLTLVYNSNVWEVDQFAYQDQNQVLPGRLFNAGLGWTLSMGQMLPPNHPSNRTPRWLYVAPDGSQHEFWDSLHPRVGDPTATGVFYTRDGSYLRLKLAGTEKKLEHVDGATHTFDTAGRLTKMEDRFGNQLTVSYATLNEWKLQDSQNRTHIVRFYSGQPYYGKIVKEVELAAFGTNPAAKYGFTYLNQPLETSCPNDVPPNANNTYQVPFLTNLSLPDGSHYSMALADYQAPNFGDSVTCDDFSGVLRRMKLPTRGKLEWDYANYTFPSEGDRCRDFFSLTVGVSKRRLISLDAEIPVHGEWQYMTDHGAPRCGPAAAPWNEMVNTVVTPLGHKTESFFSVNLTGGGDWFGQEYGLPLTRTAGTGSGGRSLSKRIHRNTNPDPAGTPTYQHVRSEYLTYEWDSPTTPADERNLNQRVVGSRTVFHDDGTTYADTAFSDFDGVGHYRTTTTSGNFAAGNARTEHTKWNPARQTYPGSYVPLLSSEPWLLSTFTEKTATEGSSTLKSEYLFEPTTGFLACTRTWRLGGGRDSGDVLVIYGRDAAGNVTSESDYGGDTQAVGPGGVCTLNAQNPLIPATPPTGTAGAPSYQLFHGYSFGTLASTQYAGAGFFSVNRQVDAKTGLVSRSCDVAGVCTHYGYDALGRLTSDKHTTDSHTLYTYVAAGGGYARVDIAEKNNAETAVLSESRVVFDEFGRVYDENKTMPDASQNRRRTLYHAEGWKATVSEVMQTAGAASARNRYQSYDPFGRVGRIRPSDVANGDARHDIDFTYFGVQTVARTAALGTVAGPTTGEADATTTEVYDRQGRLSKVLEPANPNGTNTTTTYAYDAGGRLTQVTQATANGTQVRTFGYDGRGFLTGETYPEKDAVGGAEVRYSLYDARGHARCKLDGGVRTGYAYDSAERLQKVQEVDANCNAVRDLKVFTYGLANSGTGGVNKLLGKLETATRHNYVDIGPPGAPSDHTGTIVETFIYAGQGGRVSEKKTEWRVDGFATGDIFVQKFSYDHRGQVTQLEYPRCQSCGVPALAKTVAFTYTQGFLTAVPNYASAITYHLNGLMATVAHGNGVKDRQDNDPRHLRRPALFRATTGPDAAPTNLWASGQYGYDGAGNILGMGSSTFLYDPVSRLLDSNLYTHELGTSGFKSQSYTFDGFGNLQSIATQIGVGNPTIRDTATSPVSNRLTALLANYDARGNLTTTSGATYRYGPFNESWRTTNGTEDWVHIYNAEDERVLSLKLGGPRLNRWTLRDLGGKVLREYNQVGEPAVWAVANDYIYRDALLLAADTPAGQRHYHLDHLGTPRLITNASGVKVAFHTYFPFGEEATAFNQDAERMKFTGHERDLGSGAGAGDDLDYMHARYHSPVVGRFLSVDSVGGSPRRPQSWNKYAYGEGNPGKWVDRNGQTISLATDGNSVAVKKILVAIAMRPSGRAALQTIAEMPGFDVKFRDRSLPGNKSAQEKLLKGEAAKMKFGHTWPDTTVSENVSKVTGVNVAIDTAVLKYHPTDKSGVVTGSHELYHGRDIASGKTDAETKKGDEPSSDTGPAAAFGATVKAQRADLSEEEAEKLIEKWLAAGHQPKPPTP